MKFRYSYPIKGALKNEVQHLWSNGAGGGGIWAKGTIS